MFKSTPASLPTCCINFVVDLHSLEDPLDIRADDNGCGSERDLPWHTSVFTPVLKGRASSSTQEWIITCITTRAHTYLLPSYLLP